MPSMNFAELAEEAKKSSFKFEGEEYTCSFLSLISLVSFTNSLNNMGLNYASFLCVPSFLKFSVSHPNTF